jgi:mono/diheme cytochrome c family protein
MEKQELLAFTKDSKMRTKHSCFAALLACAAILALAPASSAAVVSYAEVADLFQTRCVMCHSGPNAASGLRLDSLAALRQGGNNGPVALAGQPDSSELVRRIKGVSQPRMPMTGPPFLADSEIDLIVSWIDAGMNDSPAPLTAAAPEKRVAGEERLPNYAEVAAILGARCVKCHAERGLMGPPPEGYRLDSYAAALAGMERVRIVPGYPAASELIRRIKGQSQPRMPFDGPPFLDAQEIALITEWISAGAPDSMNRAGAYPMGARIRLNGVLTRQWQLDGGLDLHLSSRTRIDKAPGPGDTVEVRGRLGSNGSIDVDRIRRR